jgi:hypothetical protein
MMFCIKEISFVCLDILSIAFASSNKKLYSKRVSDSTSERSCGTFINVAPNTDSEYSTVQYSTVH